MDAICNKQPVKKGDRYYFALNSFLQYTTKIQGNRMKRGELTKCLSKIDGYKDEGGLPATDKKGKRTTRVYRSVPKSTVCI